MHDAQRKGFVEAFREKLEPSVPGTTIVNDGSIFLLLGIWSAPQCRRVVDLPDCRTRKGALSVLHIGWLLLLLIDLSM